MLCEETRILPNKRTFGGASEDTQVNPNGIPPYYYQKPEVTGAANGGGASKRVKKEGSAAAASHKATGIAQNGCPLCGKKRHTKTNNCPNNPNYEGPAAAK
mmetsp:Transcript_14665/g.19858  ORF Transcript_14665/g.19858 Transcript_14665/m.19858 type:complete len:101 (-) Transcript_14665:88-390(-)